MAATLSPIFPYDTFGLSWQLEWQRSLFVPLCFSGLSCTEVYISPKERRFISLFMRNCCELAERIFNDFSTTNKKKIFFRIPMAARRLGTQSKN